MAEETKNAPSEQVRHWLAEIGAAQKREDDYRKDGKRLRSLYKGEKDKNSAFNIMFSNTETILPALYSATPRPVVQRRYKDEDPTGKAASDAGQRMLEFLVDTNIEGYETFDECVTAATMDSLIPGRGVSSVKYDADIADDYVGGELACVSSESWDRVYYGYAKKWSRVPWIAYEMYVDKEEAEKLFTAPLAAKMVFTAGEDEDKKTVDDDMGERKTARVYQIWDKRGGKKVRYVSSAYPEGFLKVEDDPLGLTGFFNQPRPLEFIAKTDDIVPTAPYTLYETQAEELNSLTNRIIRITKAIKARGLYDANLGPDIEAVMTADDNELIPADKQASLAAEKGLSNAIWFMPLDILIATLRELLAAREVCKQTIYEIMGVADILRGSSNAAETLGAQQIKTQWGSLRLRPKQKEVQRYVRDLLRMMLEIAASKFSQETWARMTGLPYLTDAQFQQAQAIAQAALAQGQQEPAQQLKQAVKWADVLGILQDDVQRAYRIDIETNSTVEPEAMEDQKNISELMAAIAGFLQGIGPLVIQGVMPWEVAQTMLLAISRRFRFGAVIEDQIKAMQPPKPPAAEDKSGEMAKKEADHASQTTQLQSQLAQLQVKNQQLQSSKDLDKRAADVAMGELRLETKQQLFEMEQKAASDALRTATERESNKIDLKRTVAGYENKAAKAEGGAAKQITGKVDAGVAALTQQVEAMQQRADQHSQQLAGLMKAVSAPRKRTPIRDPQGRLVGATDELVG